MSVFSPLRTSIRRCPSASKSPRPTYLQARIEPLERRTLMTANPVINEIYFDPPGSAGDNVDEYIELRGTPNQSLANTYLIFLENENNALDTGNPGMVERIFDLGNQTLGTNGFLTLRQKNNPYTVAAGTTDLVNSGTDQGWGSGPTSSLNVVAENDQIKIENSGFTAMLIRNNGPLGSAPFIGQDLDVNNDGFEVPGGNADWTTLDSIGIHSEFGEAEYGRLYAPINFGPEPSTNIEPGATFVNVGYEIEFIARYGNSTGQTAADWDVSNLTNDPLSGYVGPDDFRQSGDPQGAPTVVETNQGIPYGTVLTQNLGGPNYPFLPLNNATVASTHLFYKGSTRFNVTNNNLPGFSDDNAIAPDKTAYLPGGGAAAFSAVSSYSRGLNGLMVDVAGTHGAITANDFTFKVGNNNSPSLWSAATAPTNVTTRSGAGTSGSDRVELMWANNAIQKQWLEVIVEGNDATGGFNTNTGLASSYVFYFGNALGDAGVSDPTTFLVSGADEQSARNNPKSTLGTPALITDINDFNRDGNVNTTDQQIPRNNTTNAITTALKFLTVGAGGPFAPTSEGSVGGEPVATPQAAADLGIASALASAGSTSGEPLNPGARQDRLERVVHRLNNYFTHLADEATPRDIAILEAADRFAHEHGFDREAEFLDDLLSGLETPAV